MLDRAVLRHAVLFGPMSMLSIQHHGEDTIIPRAITIFLTDVMAYQVVGWGEDVEELAAGLAEFAVDGSLVTVISSERPRGLPEGLRGCRFRHVEGSPTSFSSFQQAGLADCDSLLLGMPPPQPLTLHPLPFPLMLVPLSPNPPQLGLADCAPCTWVHTPHPYPVTLPLPPLTLPPPPLLPLRTYLYTP